VAFLLSLPLPPSLPHLPLSLTYQPVSHHDTKQICLSALFHLSNLCSSISSFRNGLERVKKRWVRAGWGEGKKEIKDKEK
jgi:hypothetical protein